MLAWQRTIGDQRASSRRIYLSSVRVFCAWAVDEGLLAVDPTTRLAKVREPGGKPRSLSAGQYARLVMVLPDERARLIVGLMRHCGLRCVEVARLTGAAYDPGRVAGKGGDWREVLRLRRRGAPPRPLGRASSGCGPITDLQLLVSI